jgi:antitoxin ParD1/3/4
MGTMNVSLPDDLIAFVRDETQGGGYGNNSDVVRDALRLLRERRQKHAALLAAIAEGDADIRAGRTSPLTEDRLRDIAERARARGRKRKGEA